MDAVAEGVAEDSAAVQGDRLPTDAVVGVTVAAGLASHLERAAPILPQDPQRAGFRQAGLAARRQCRPPMRRSLPQRRQRLLSRRSRRSRRHQLQERCPPRPARMRPTRSAST